MFQHKIITHKFQTFWNHRIKLFHSHSTGRVLKGSFTSLLIVSKRLAQIQQLALQQFARMAQERFAHTTPEIPLDIRQAAAGINHPVFRAGSPATATS